MYVGTRISAGSYEFKMELDDGEQYREHRNICDIMACPIEPGNFIFKTMQQVPNIPIPVRIHTICTSV